MQAQFERFALSMTRRMAESGSHAGQCDADVEALVRLPVIRRQLDRIDPALIAAELKEYGAWDETELSDADANRERIVWIACGNIREELAQARRVGGIVRR